MPGPHSHTNPPSVFTQWPSQEELKHSSMSAKRENSLAQPGPRAHRCPRKKDRVPGKSPRGGGGTRPFLIDPPDQRPERVAETALWPTGPPTRGILGRVQSVGRRAD